MTPQYIMKKSACRPAHCYSAHVPGEGWVNRGGDPATKDDYDRQRMRSIDGEIECMGYAKEYAEPGYQDPTKCVLWANWNVFPRDLPSILENYGYSIEWSDEWTTCGDCGKAIRTQPNSYSWQPYYVLLNDCEIICLDCVDWQSYLESIEDDSDMACVAECNPADYGYTLVDDSFEHGLHPGQTDDPQAILKRLMQDGSTGYVFRIRESRQFDTRFEVYKRNEED
jgi:hypothetical protein